METEDPQIGMALYLACYLAQMDRESSYFKKERSVEELIDFVRPPLGEVFEDIKEDHPIALLDTEGELNPDGITPLMRKLVQAAVDGEIKPLVCSHIGVVIDECGERWKASVIDFGYFWTFMDRLKDATNPVIYRGEQDVFCAAIDLANSGITIV
jgi:hypothetical protein